MCRDALNSLGVRKSGDRPAHSLVKIEYVNARWTVIKNLPSTQVRNADAYGVTVTDESEAFAISPPCDVLALKYHVGGLHVYLVEDAQWSRTILDDIRNRIHSSAEVDLVRFGHC